jgi:hypothetical protein
MVITSPFTIPMCLSCLAIFIDNFSNFWRVISSPVQSTCKCFFFSSCKTRRGVLYENSFVGIFILHSVVKDSSQRFVGKFRVAGRTYLH